VSPPKRLIPGLIALLAVVLLAGVLLGVGGASTSTSEPWHETLSGPWAVHDDPGDVGRLQDFSAGRFRGARVHVPFVPNAARVTGPAGIRSFDGSLTWYRTRFTVPEDGRYALDFQSVNHRAHVWLDGRSLGGHIGVYLPFEKRFRTTKGTHTLVVRADYRDPAEMKREAWHRTWFNFGGIDRSVTLRKLADVDLTAPAVTTRLKPGGTADVEVDVHVRNWLPTPRSVVVQGTLSHGDRKVTLDFPAVEVPPRGWRVARLHVPVENPALWSPDAPNLYDLHFEIAGQTAWDGRTGLRELRKRGEHLYLNGRLLALHGASINEDAAGHGDGLTGRDMDGIVAELKAIHANCTRSQHALSPALLDRLDAAGIMVWQGVGPVDAPGAWTSTTTARQRVARQRVITSLNQLRLHPSIIAWSLANEIAGDGHPGGQAQYVDDMAQELHRRDPGRIVSVDIWGAHAPASQNGLIYRHLDAVGLTNYVGWYDDTYAPRATVSRLVRSTVDRFGRTFAGKVIVVTEFGAEASAANQRLQPGGFGFQTRLLATHLRAYKGDNRLSGMLIWVLRDFAVAPSFAGGSIHRIVPGIQIVKGINQKGLYNYIGRPKPAVHAVGQAYARLATFP
jgi:hypothetical protein